MFGKHSDILTWSFTCIQEVSVLLFVSNQFNQCVQESLLLLHLLELVSGPGSCNSLVISHKTIIHHLTGMTLRIC